MSFEVIEFNLAITTREHAYIFTTSTSKPNHDYKIGTQNKLKERREEIIFRISERTTALVLLG